MYRLEDDKILEVTEIYLHEIHEIREDKGDMWRFWGFRLSNRLIIIIEK